MDKERQYLQSKRVGHMDIEKSQKVDREGVELRMTVGCKQPHLCRLQHPEKQQNERQTVHNKRKLRQKSLSNKLSTRFSVVS